MYGYIYEMLNTVNGMMYVGQHRSAAFDKKYHGSGKQLLKAIKEYGIDAFSIRIIFDDISNQNELDAAEIYWIYWYFDTYGKDRMYNMRRGGYFQDDTKRLKIYDDNPEYKKKLADAIYSQDRCGENHPFYGHHHTEEAKLKISIASTGRKHTEESKRKLSESKMGHEVSQETRDKISQKLTGHKPTPEHKKNIGLGTRRRYEQDPTLREKQSELMKGENNPFYGKKHAVETRENHSKRMKEYFKRYSDGLNNILFYAIEIYPDIQNWTISKRISLVNEISKEHKKYIINT